MNKPYFDNFLPLTSGLLPWIVLMANDSLPNYAFVIAIVVSVILVIAWLFSQTGWIGRLIKGRLFRSKLSSEQSARLSVLLGDINQTVSYSHTHSPFYIWHSLSNKHQKQVRMDYQYHTSIQTWLLDIKRQVEDPVIKNMTLFVSLSKAVSATNVLAEKVEKDLEHVIGLGEISEQEARRLRKDWDTARTQFNQWISGFRTLFKEINNKHHLGCIDFFNPIQLVV